MNKKIAIYLLFIGFMVIASFGSILFYYTSAENVLTGQTLNYFDTIAQSRASHIESFILNNLDSAKIIMSCDCIKNSMYNVAHGIDVEASTASIQEHLESFTKRSDNFFELMIIDTNGIIIASYMNLPEGEMHTKTEIGTNFENEEAFIKGLKGPEIIDTHVHDNFDVIGYVGPITDEREEEINGVLIAHQALNEELNIFDSEGDSSFGINKITTDKTGLGETGEIYLINKDGFMITPSRFFPEEQTFLKQQVDTISSRNCFIHTHEFGEEDHFGHEEQEELEHEEIQIFENYRGARVLGTHVYIPKMQWCLLAEIGEREAIGLLRDELLKSALFILIITTIIMGIFIMISNRFILGGHRSAYPKRKGVK